MEKQERSLACRIKDEVDELVAKGEFHVVHMDYRTRLQNGIECGCALGVVSKLAVGKKYVGNGREAAITAIHKRWPEIPDHELRNMECAFEGWNGYSTCAENRVQHKSADKDSEFYKLGLHIKSYAKGRTLHVLQQLLGLLPQLPRP